MWYDEIQVVRVVQLDLKSLFMGAKSHVSAPPLDYLFLHVVAKVCQSEFCLRLPAVLWGILSLVLTYKIGERLLGKKTALLGTFLLAISNFHIHYSREIKFYSILVFFALLSIWFFLEAMRRRTACAWLVYALVMAVGAYAHSFVFLVGLVEGLWALGQWLLTHLRPASSAEAKMHSAQDMIAFALCCGSAVLCFAPWLLWDFSGQTVPVEGEPTAFTLAFVLRFFKDMVLDYRPLSSMWIWPPGTTSSLIEIPASAILSYAVLAAALLGSLALLVRRRSRRGSLLIGLVVIPLPIIVLLDNVGRYWFTQRQALFVLPAYLLLAACGLLLIGETLGALMSRAFGAVAKLVPLAILIAAVGLVSAKPISADYHHEVQNWRDAALILSHEAEPGDQVFGWSHAAPLLIYYDPGLRDWPIQRLEVASQGVLEAVVGKAHGRVWYVRDQSRLDERESIETLASSSALVTVDLGSVLVSLWPRSDESPLEGVAEKRALLEEAAALCPSYPIRIALGELYMQDHRPDAAAAQFEEAVKLDPRWGLGHTKLGNAYSGQGQTEMAVRSYVRSVRVDPTYVGAYINLGAIYDEQGRDEETIALYQKAVELVPGSAWAHSVLGSAYLKKGDATTGLGHLEHAVELEPGNVTWLLALAGGLRGLGQDQEAADTYRQVLELQPGNHQATEALQALSP